MDSTVVEFSRTTILNTRSLRSYIDLHTHAGSTFDNHVTLTFNILISESVCVEPLAWFVCTKFSLDSSSRFSFIARTQTHRQADATGYYTHSSATAGVGKYQVGS